MKCLSADKKPLFIGRGLSIQKKWVDRMGYRQAFIGNYGI